MRMATMLVCLLTMGVWTGAEAVSQTSDNKGAGSN
jgi:hypothetical protein